MDQIFGRSFTCLLEGWFFVVPVEPLEEHLLPVCLLSPSSVIVLVSRLGDRHRVLSELPICLLEMVGRTKLRRYVVLYCTSEKGKANLL